MNEFLSSFESFVSMLLKGDRGRRGKNGSPGTPGAIGPPGQQVPLLNFTLCFTTFTLSGVKSEKTRINLELAVLFTGSSWHFWG